MELYHERAVYYLLQDMAHEIKIALDYAVSKQVRVRLEKAIELADDFVLSDLKKLRKEEVQNGRTDKKAD